MQESYKKHSRRQLQLAPISITFEQIEEFTYILPDYSEEPYLEDALINFLEKNSSIIKLNVESAAVRNFNWNTSKIVGALLLLQEINFIYFRLSYINVIQRKLQLT